MNPVRLQLSRKKGFNLQGLSKSTNGLPAVVVSRPSDWGNPYTVEEYGYEAAAALYEDDLKSDKWLVKQIREKLKGKNLACWCPLDQPYCHANALLKIANS